MEVEVTGKSGRRIAVGIDGSPGSDVALRYAIGEAALREAEVLALYVYQTDTIWISHYPSATLELDSVRVSAEEDARKQVERCRSDPGVKAATEGSEVVIHVETWEGHPSRQLVEASKGADLLVVGSRGRGKSKSILLGSVALHSATHAHCPVMVVHPVPPAHTTAPNVVVGVDGSEFSRSALAAGLQEADLRGGTLTVVRTYELSEYWNEVGSLLVVAGDEIGESLRPETAELVEEGLAAHRTGSEGGPPPVEIVIREGAAVDVLLEASRSSDLLVVGCRGHSRIRGLLLGSVALGAVMHANCPVLVVHPEDDFHAAQGRA